MQSELVKMKSLLIILFSLTLLLVSSCEGREVSNSRDVDPSHQSSFSALSSNTTTVLTVCLSAISFLFITILIIFKCTDCYNSEVSSEFHPASANNGGSSRENAPKWGGAVGYNSESNRAGHASFRETVDINQAAQGLPYSFIPTEIPQTSGFSGYQQARGDGGDGHNTTAAAPLMGYQGYGAQPVVVTNQDSNRNTTGTGSRHYNPAETDERAPPPNYSEALRQPSVSGNS